MSLWMALVPPLVSAILTAIAVIWGQKITDWRQARIRAEERKEARWWREREELQKVLEGIMDILEGLYIEQARLSELSGRAVDLCEPYDPGASNYLVLTAKLQRLARQSALPSIRECFLRSDLDTKNLDEWFKVVEDVYAEINPERRNRLSSGSEATRQELR